MLNFTISVSNMCHNACKSILLLYFYVEDNRRNFVSAVYNVCRNACKTILFLACHVWMLVAFNNNRRRSISIVHTITVTLISFSVNDY